VMERITIQGDRPFGVAGRSADRSGS